MARPRLPAASATLPGARPIILRHNQLAHFLHTQLTTYAGKRPNLEIRQMKKETLFGSLFVMG
jgi:hypothetical protein